MLKQIRQGDLKLRLEEHNPAVVKQPHEAGEDAVLQEIRSEVNLLTLPFFALSKKGLSKRTKLEYRAVLRKGDKQLEVLWRVNSMPDYGYPGPFDKKVHKAVEQILSSMHPPIQNPISLGSLYHITKFMGLQDDGRTYRKIKKAFERLVTTSVESRGAFYNKGKEEWIEDVFHIYDRVIFKGKKLPDGRIADTNYLFLNSWYLDNINARYVKPLDYGYYIRLKSTIAQRLYELLGVKFYRIIKDNLKCLRYRYSTLCQLLPVTRQRYFSKAKEKLDPAHQELIETGFLEKVVWQDAADGTESLSESSGTQLSTEADWFIYYYPGPKARAEVERYKTSAEPILLEEEEQVTQLELALTPSDREVEVKALVEEMISVLGDAKNRPFYMKVAKLCQADLIYRCLSEVKDEWHRKLIRTTKGAVFTDKIKRYCQQRGIELGLKSDKRKEG